MKKDQLQIGRSLINYYRLGKGKRLLIAFHGYGVQAQVFQPFEAILRDEYTIYAIDLPFHGKTQWSNDQYDTKAVLDIIDVILEMSGHPTFDLLGHSFGAHIIMALLDKFKDRPLEHVFLLAPGGIRTRGMQLPLLVPDWVRRWMKLFLDKPKFVFGLSNSLYKIGVIDRFSHRFIQQHYSSEKKRKALWYTWFSLNSFNLRRYRIKKASQDKGYLLHFILGKRDPLVPEKIVREWQETIPNSTLHYLEDGHKIVKEDTALLIRKLIT